MIQRADEMAVRASDDVCELMASLARFITTVEEYRELTRQLIAQNHGLISENRALRTQLDTRKQWPPTGDDVMWLE